MGEPRVRNWPPRLSNLPTIIIVIMVINNTSNLLLLLIKSRLVDRGRYHHLYLLDSLLPAALVLYDSSFSASSSHLSDLVFVKDDFFDMGYSHFLTSQYFISLFLSHIPTFNMLFSLL